MTFVPFQLERWQSVWEHRVRYNLSESGVHPLSLAELLDLTETDLDEARALRLGYSQTNGTDELRAAIAASYPGATADNVLVTVGGSEANFLTTWTRLGPGDRATVQVPNYLQTWGVARSNGADVATFALRLDRGWEPDLEEMRSAIRSGTRLVVVTDPNNPTGHVLSPEAREAILERVREVGAWLLVDEVYRGAELDGEASPTWWGGSYDRVIVSNGLSKAYGLPGLRIGWLVGPAEFIQEAWQRHDYTVIGPSALSDFLAVRALRHRERILARTRRIVRENYQLLDTWLRTFGELFAWRAPQAGAICLVEYRLATDPEALVEHLRATQDVLLVPGTHVGLSNHLRFGFGDPAPYLTAALDAVGKGLGTLTPD